MMSAWKPEASCAPPGSARAPSASSAELAPAFDPSTALVVVDMQNDFADPAGSLYVRGGEEIVPIVNELTARARESGALVVYTADWHPEHTPHFAREGGIWPVHCVRETWGARLHPGLAVAGEIVRKGVAGEEGYSGFSMRDARDGATKTTRLEGLLRRHRIEKVVIVGLATDWCVKETALDGRRLGFDVTVDTRASRAVELRDGDGRRAVEEMRAAGVHVL